MVRHPHAEEPLLSRMKRLENRNHTMLGSYVDENLSLLLDYNQVLKVGIDSISPDGVILTLDTGLSELALLTKNCNQNGRCMHIPDTNDYWQPSESQMIDYKTYTGLIDYFFFQHMSEVRITGKHYGEQMCMERDKCAQFSMFAVDSADPFFMIMADGVLGLGIDVAYGGTPGDSMNVLDQMIDHQIIQKRIFGLYTKVKNDTDDTSQVRFGGYNEDLFEKDENGQVSHELVWIPTLTTNSWMLQCPQIDFNKDHITAGSTKALINPSFPFISAPKNDFLKFREDLKSVYSDKPLICTDYEFCYFETVCSDIISKVKPLVIKLGGDKDGEYFSVPPESFLFDEEDLKESGNTCHLAIVG